MHLHREQATQRPPCPQAGMDRQADRGAADAADRGGEPRRRPGGARKSDLIL